MKKYNIVKAEQELFNSTAIGEWLDCLFEDKDSGEQFYVELRKFNHSITDFIDDCLKVAKDNFDNPHFEELVSVEVAEMMGLDTY